MFPDIVISRLYYLFSYLVMLLNIFRICIFLILNVILMDQQVEVFFLDLQTFILYYFYNFIH